MGEAKRRAAHIAAGGEDWGLRGYRGAGSARGSAKERVIAVAEALADAFTTLKATIAERTGHGGSTVKVVREPARPLASAIRARKRAERLGAT